MAKKAKKRPKGHPRHYLVQWRGFRGLTQDQFAAQMFAIKASFVSIPAI